MNDSHRPVIHRLHHHPPAAADRISAPPPGTRSARASSVARRPRRDNSRSPAAGDAAPPGRVGDAGLQAGIPTTPPRLVQWLSWDNKDHAAQARGRAAWRTANPPRFQGLNIAPVHETIGRRAPPAPRRPGDAAETCALAPFIYPLGSGVTLGRQQHLDREFYFPEKFICMGRCKKSSNKELPYPTGAGGSAVSW
jgi:hypothetical protein